MSIVSRLKQLAVAGVALTSFAEASNNSASMPDDTIERIEMSTRPQVFTDSKTAAGELYKHLREEEKKKPNLSTEERAQIVSDFIDVHNISDKHVYDMMLNYTKYATEYMRETENKKANNRVFGSDREAVYAAFTQTSFYKTERDRIIKRWMPMAEAVSEGYYRYGYKCTAGHPTIGIGTCLTTSGLSLDDIPIRHIKKDKNGKYLYENGEPVPGDELTLQEKQKFKQALKNLGSSSYSVGKKLTEDRGIYGLTLADARQVATLESQKKMDEILKFAFMIKNVDMFKEPTALGVVALDIHYQCGTLTSSKEWPKFWECVCTKNYSDLRNHIKVNNGANVNRHLVKETLCDYIAADYTATHSKNLKARNRAWKQRSLNYEILCGYGVDIYGLKRRSVPTPYYIQTYNAGIGMAKAAPAAPKLVKREISPERRAEFEQVRKMIKESSHRLTSDGGSVGQTPVANAPKIKTSGKTLRELQKKTRELPKNKRAKRMNRQQLTELARQNNINSENLIHLTIQGGVDINVCVDYLKKETQKVNNAVLQQKRSQGR